MTETQNRVYDANLFDWNEGGGVLEDQDSVSEVETLIREALQVTDTVEDAWLRPSAVDNDRARVTFNVPYALDGNQKAYMQEMVGDARTLTFNARGYHDHPMSHCITEISEDMVVRQFGDEPFVDVWGNASRHRRMGHKGAKVVSSKMVPHDWFRNRGCEESVTDCATFVNSGGHLRYRLFLSTHGLYYMTLDQVASWMGGNMDAEFHAIVHRHDKSKGHLNKGELSYTVDSDGYVRQINPLSGFTYRHRSIEPLFHTDSCRVLGGKGGLTWDINKLAGDTYHIKFVLCDPGKANDIQDPWMLIEKDREVYIRGDVQVCRILGFEWYVYDGSRGRTLLEDVELYDRLRRTISGKERTPKQKNELMAMCRRLANKNDIISIHQGFHHDVDPALMADYVKAAFYADVKHELEVALKFHRENKDAVAALNRFYTEGIAPTDFTNIAKIGRAVATPFNELVGLLNHSHYGPRDGLFGSKLRGIEEIEPPDPFTVPDVDLAIFQKQVASFG